MPHINKHPELTGRACAHLATLDAIAYAMIGKDLTLVDPAVLRLLGQVDWAQLSEDLRALRDVVRQGDAA